VDLLEEREALGLGGENPALQHRSERKRVGRIWREDRRWLLFFGAPLAAYGVATSLVPYLSMRALLWLSPPHFYRAALAKVLLGALFFAAFYGVSASAVWGLGGPIAASVYALSVVPAGLFARRYLVEMRLHRIGPSWIWRVLRHRGRVAMWKAERDLLAEELAALRTRYLAEHAEQESVTSPPA
jgi:hypothetical protein